MRARCFDEFAMRFLNARTRVQCAAAGACSFQNETVFVGSFIVGAAFCFTRCFGSNIPGQFRGSRFSLLYSFFTAMPSRSVSILTSAKDNAVHNRQRRGPALKKLRRHDVIAIGQRAGLGHRNKETHYPLAVQQITSVGHKNAKSIQGKKLSTSFTSNRYYTNTKAIKDV